ncbi:MAG TPA: hypothetical protein VF712_09930 [Thermoleophilaceae bacterium]
MPITRYPRAASARECAPVPQPASTTSAPGCTPRAASVAATNAAPIPAGATSAS